MTKAMPVPSTPSAATAAIGPSPGALAGAVTMRGNQQHERTRSHHPGDDAERRASDEPVLDDKAPDRVAEAGQHDRKAAEQCR